MRPLRATLLSTAAALSFSACATFDNDDVAARVGDSELTFEQVEDALGADASNAAAVRDLVGRFAINESLRADLAALGVETPPIDLGDDPVAALDAALGVNVQNWQTIPADQLADSETRRAYESGSAPIACLAHVLTETEAGAEAALDRIDSGEPFAAVAAETSIDTGSAARGGSLGCLPESAVATTYVPEFAEAADDVAVGEVIGPVESDFGFHLVTRIGFEQLDQTQLLQLRLSRFDERYDIEVDPQIGQWTGFGEIAPLG